MSESEIRERLDYAVRPAFEKSFDPAADLARGRRRRRRNRAVGGTASCAALAAVAALVVPALPSGPGGSDGPADGGDAVGPTYVRYGTSVIHDGDREIDVSPYEVEAFARTDEGFVFQTPAGSVYFADGADVVRIGESATDSSVVSDDSGSYVGWIAPSLETVVYDTSREVEALRMEIGDGNASSPPDVTDIDGDIVYVRQRASGRNVGLAWEFVADEPVPSNGALSDVSDGYITRTYWPRRQGDPGRVIVSRDPDAAGPRISALEDSLTDRGPDLSPSGRYLLGDKPPSHVVLDRASQEDVTPVVYGHYQSAVPGYWIDDDQYVLWGHRGSNRPYDLLVCSVSVGTCEVAVRTNDRFTFPR